MARQWITIAKIAGPVADVVIGSFRKWAAQESDASKAFPQARCGELEEFYKVLQANGDAPPVLFYCRYLDLWSMGLFERLLERRQGGSAWIRVSPDFVEGAIEGAAYALPDGGMLASSLEQLRNDVPEVAFEDRWFAQTLYEACTCWELLYSKAVLLFFRHDLGASVLDDEVVASQDQVPDWLKEIFEGTGAS